MHVKVFSQFVNIISVRKCCMFSQKQLKSWTSFAVLIRGQAPKVKLYVGNTFAELHQKFDL